MNDVKRRASIPWGDESGALYRPLGHAGPHRYSTTIDEVERLVILWGDRRNTRPKAHD